MINSSCIVKLRGNSFAFDGAHRPLGVMQGSLAFFVQCHYTSEQRLFGAGSWAVFCFWARNLV